MHIITEEGKIVEGQALTTEELAIMQDLIDGDIFYGRVGEYISKQARAKIAAALIADFRLIRRHPAPEVEAAPEIMPPGPTPELIPEEEIEIG